MSDWHEATISAAQLLDDLEAEYGEQNVEVGAIAIVVEISNKAEDGEEYTGIHYRCTDAKRWVQAGLFVAAQRAVYASSEATE